MRYGKVRGSRGATHLHGRGGQCNNALLLLWVPVLQARGMRESNV